MTHKTPNIHSHQKRRKDAQALLDTYQGAELVITKRLHCALPCAAMGTPVILIGDNPRFSGMEKFVTIVKKADQVEGAIDQARNFDRTESEKYADRLRKTVEQWLM
jgi:exopolysaccharide biosynthesis predicted pyruvyltransferase EpsI